MLRKYKKTIDIFKFFTNESRFMSMKANVRTNATEFGPNNLSQKQLLQDCLGLTYPQAAKFIRQNKFISDLNNDRLFNAIKILKKVGISQEGIYRNPITLNYLENSLEHNTKYLKEIGVKDINAQMLTRFRSLVKKPISLIKLHGIIAEDTNVVKRLCCCLKPNPIKHISLTELSDTDSVLHVHEEIFKKYLVWRLECSEEKVDQIFKTYDGFRYKSFELISKMMDLLTKELGFNNVKILQHAYLFETNAKAVKKLIKTLPTLVNLDIKKVLYRHPKLMTVPIDNIQQIAKHIHDFGISDEAVQKCLEIFTLAPDSVSNRLQELKNIPEFEVLIKNPRIVYLLLLQNKAKMRLELLRNLNINNPSLHVLCGSDIIFEKFTQDGFDRTNGTDMVNYLATELQRPFKEIRDCLNLNQHWNHIPITSAKSTFSLLKEKGFSIAQIADVPTILLYTKEQIDNTLKEINTKLSQTQTRIGNRQKLNLCLYVIEKKYHFSGNGIWRMNNNGEEK